MSYFILGPDHGVCDCGKCKCKEGWSGSDCSCSTSVQNCIQPGTEVSHAPVIILVVAKYENKNK